MRAAADTDRHGHTCNSSGDSRGLSSCLLLYHLLMLLPYFLPLPSLSCITNIVSGCMRHRIMKEMSDTIFGTSHGWDFCNRMLSSNKAAHEACNAAQWAPGVAIPWCASEATDDRSFVPAWRCICLPVFCCFRNATCELSKED